MYKKFMFTVSIAMAVVAANCFAQTDKKEMSESTKKSLQSLTDFQWQNRIILVKQSVLCDDTSLAFLRNENAAIDDRHILWFVICDGEVQSNYSGVISNQFPDYLNNKYFVRDDLNAILIGKDGGVKSRTESLNLQGLFALIDTMPMRQSEMRR